MWEIFTTGGGEYIVNTLNAVSAWTGGGGFRSLLRVVFVMGLLYAATTMAWNLDWRSALRWFMQATLVYGCLMVPTVSVRVTDRVNPSLAPAVVGNVPIGLGVMASITSQMGDWMTRTAETAFVMPSSLSYSNNGIVYGAKMWEKVNSFELKDPVFKYNLESYVKQCVFYDILLGQRSLRQLQDSKDLWTDIGTNAAVNRGIKYMKEVGGVPEYVGMTCAAAYTDLNIGLTAVQGDAIQKYAKAVFPKRTVAAAVAKVNADLPIIGNQATGNPLSAPQLFRQKSVVDAFANAQVSFGNDDADLFASMRAEQQARNVSIGVTEKAMTWVPYLHIILTIVFYAMFPVIFPLFLFPSVGLSTLKGYLSGFFYLAAWGPLYVLLHMFVMDRFATETKAVADGGLTLANFAGIQAVNTDIATLAGFMMMSVPVLAGMLARGAMGAASSAASWLAPVQSGAEAAAVERTTGNYSFGNVSYENLNANNRQMNQWTTAPSYMSGSAISAARMPNGSTITQTADGSMVYDTVSGATSRFADKPSLSSGTVASLSQALGSFKNKSSSEREAASSSLNSANSYGASTFKTAESRVSSGQETGNGVTNSLRETQNLEQSWSNHLQNNFGVSAQDASRMARTAMINGGFSAELGRQIGLGVGVKGSSTQELNGSRSTTSEEGWRDAYDYLNRESRSSDATNARESFFRATSSSSDSEISGLSQKRDASLTEAKGHLVESQRLNEAGERWSRDMSLSQSNGFQYNRDLSQDFANFADLELAKDDKLAGSGYRPWMNPSDMTPQQYISYTDLKGRFESSYVDKLKKDLGPLDTPQAHAMNAPSIATVDGDVRSSAAANISQLTNDGPNLDIRKDSRNSELDSQVGGRLEASQDRLNDRGQAQRSAYVTASRDGDSLQNWVTDRLNSPLIETTPLLSNGYNAVKGMSAQNQGSASLVSSAYIGAEMPVDGQIRSGVGLRVHPITGKHKQHNGVDVGKPAGSPIQAPAGGVISDIGYQRGGAGHYMVINHGNGIQTKYFHMQQRPALWAKGDQISQGDILGRVGSTGASTGPHLHYEIWKDGKVQDPSLVAVVGGTKSKPK
jgi:conjugal transfer mating pair stabilization protein TraG